VDVKWEEELERSVQYLGYRAKLDTRKEKSLGDSSGRDTPGSIPNPEVKPASADGTWGAAPWESRSLPRDFFLSFSFVLGWSNSQKGLDKG
jgi:hypothetical protein